MRAFSCLLLASVGLFRPLLAQDAAPTKSLPGPAPWQIAGIRAAFGDARAPIAELSPAVQREALKLCAEHGWGAELDPQEVAVYLGSEDRPLQFAALSALRQMDARAGRFAKEIAALFSIKPEDDADGKLRRTAIGVLGRLGAESGAAVEAVVPLLQDARPVVRACAIEALSAMDKPVVRFEPEIAAAFTDRVGVPEAAVAGALGAKSRNHATFAPQLAALLAAQDPTVRRAAARTLAAMLQERSAFTLQIEALLGNPDEIVRDLAFFTLEKLRENDAELSLKMAHVFDDEPRFDRLRAEALEQMTAFGPNDSRQLASPLRSRNLAWRDTAIAALSKLAQEHAVSSSGIETLLENADHNVRAGAAAAVGRMEPVQPLFAGKLAAMLSDPEVEVRREAAAALRRIGRAAAVAAPQLAAALGDADGETRGVAAAALGTMGSAAGNFAPAMAALLQDPDSAVRRRAICALGDLGENAASCAAQVASALNDPQSVVRSNAAEALGRMGSPAAAFAPRVAVLLKDSDGEVQGAAAAALSRMGKSGAVFAPEIAVLLGSSDPHASRPAASALERMRHPGAEPSNDAAPQPSDPTHAEATPRLANGSAGATVDPWRLTVDLPNRGRVSLQATPNAVGSLLSSTDPALRDALAGAFDQRGIPAGDLEMQAALLAAAHTAPDYERPNLRAHLRLWAGDNAAMQRLVTWLGKPDLEPLPKDGLPPAETRETLAVFRDLWDYTEKHAALRTELAGRVAQLAKAIASRPDDETRQILTELAEKLKAEPGLANAHEAVEAALGK
jgi:HEAT repeat protein